MDGLHSQLNKAKDKIGNWMTFRRKYADLQRQKNENMEIFFKKVEDLWYRIFKKSNIIIIKTQKERNERI